MVGLYGAGGALGTMAGGVLADRWGRRPTMLTAQFGASALMLALGFAHTYAQIAVVTFLLGLVAEAARPAISAMLVDVVPDHDRVRAFSLNYWAINLGFALAAVIAGFAATLDYTLLFVVDATTTAVTAIITAMFLAETQPVRSRTAGPAVPHGGLGAALKDRVFLVYLVLTFMSVLVVMQHLSMLPLSMLADGLTASTYGTVIAVNGVLIVAGQLFVPRLIQGRDSSRVLAVATLLIGAGFGLVALAETPIVYGLTVVVWTLGEMLQSPSNATTVAMLSPPALRGRYQGLNSLAWQLGSALAPVLGGAILQHGGDVVLWVGSFALCALAAVGHLLAGPARARRSEQRNAAMLRAADDLAEAGVAAERKSS